MVLITKENIQQPHHQILRATIPNLAEATLRHSQPRDTTRGKLLWVISRRMTMLQLYNHSKINTLSPIKPTRTTTSRQTHIQRIHTVQDSTFVAKLERIRTG